MKNLLLILAVTVVLAGSTGCTKNAVPLAPMASTVSAPAPAVETAAYSLDWTGNLSNPVGLAVDGSGVIYVADSDINLVLKFDSNGNQTGQMTGAPGKNFKNPFGVALDASGNIYVADAGNHRVQELNQNGGLVKMIDSTSLNSDTFSYPRGVAIAANGSVLVSDLTHLVWQLDFITAAVPWGKNGNLDGQFNFPIGMGTDSSDNVYVADYQANKIIKFNTVTKTATSFGQAGSGKGEFLNPMDVKVDKNGFVFVVDTGNNRIQEFDANGTFLAQFGQGNTVALQNLNHPVGVAISQDGNLYVTDNGNSRVVKYTLK